MTKINFLFSLELSFILMLIFIESDTYLFLYFSTIMQKVGHYLIILLANGVSLLLSAIKLGCTLSMITERNNYHLPSSFIIIFLFIFIYLVIINSEHKFNVLCFLLDCRKNSVC